MPLFKEIKDTHFQMAIWKISETELFFQKETGLNSIAKLEHRRLEYLTARYLLKKLHPEIQFKNIKINTEGKPFLPDEEIHFSISHSFPYVGVIISQKLVGIDVQTYQNKILRLQHKFLSTEEQFNFQNDIEQITMAWAAKEAAFKWSEQTHFNFIQHLPILDYQFKKAKAKMIIEVRKNEPFEILQLKGQIESDFAWMITQP